MGEETDLHSTIRLLATGCCMPEKVLSNTDLEKLVNTSDDWIMSRTGIRERRVVSEGEENSDLAAGAARQALETAGMDPKDVDHIIVCTFTADMLLPSTACAVQDKLGAINASAVDLAAACTGFIYGLSHAAGMILSGQSERVLVIASETLSKVTDYQDRGTCILFGDGAGAAVVDGGEGGHRIGNFFLAADGSGRDILNIPAGGSTHPASAETLANRSHYIKMKGQEVFKFAVTKIMQLIKSAADHDGIAPGDFDLVVPHQVNRRIIRAAVDRLDMHEDQFFMNMEKYGNTSGASVAIALDEAVRSGAVKEGHKILVMAFGGGFTWGSSVIHW
jgi:3-oxoacyl-[acyl-carrier-protein] synthase III